MYSLDESKYYFQKNIDGVLTPASATKLFTTFSALYTLGADYNIRTSIYTDAHKVDSVLKGNIYIYGRGDALLSVSDRMRQIKELLRFRRPFYERSADNTINTSRMGVESVAKRIIEIIKENESHD